MRNGTDINDSFFNPSLYKGKIGDEEYAKMQITIDTLDALSRTCNLNVYVIDYYKRNILYSSPDHLFLNDLSIDEFKAMGFLYFKRYTPRKDYEFLQKINKEGFKFFYNLPVDGRLDYTLSYNFNFLIKNKEILVNHKVTPIKLNKENQIWLSMCFVDLAAKEDDATVEIKNLKTSERFILDQISWKWQKANPIVLTAKEIMILRLSKQGFSSIEIGERMCLDVNTIKFHKKSIFAKLNVSNIDSAISSARNNKLI